MPPVGLIGLGLVGAALAERFRAAGFAVVGYDIDAAKREKLRATGGTVVDSPAAVARAVRRIVLSLPDSAVVARVVDDLGGDMASSATIVDTTTGDPEPTAALAARLHERGIGYLDATILGSSAQVLSGDVLVMAGGDPATLDACRDILDSFARRVFLMGANGKGAEAKLVVNLVLGLNRLVLAEGLVLGRKAGIDPDTLLAVLRDGAAYSRVMDTKGEKMLRGDYSPQAKLAQHLKDVELILALGARTNTPLPASALHAQLLRAGVASGLGELDNSAILRVLERLAGLDSAS